MLEKDRNRFGLNLSHHQFVMAVAKELNNNLPASEKWFWRRWRELAMDIESDRANVPKFGYIPDILNEEFSYVIEVDGSVHNNPKIKEKDLFRDQVFRNRGFSVVRVKAYCEKSLIACVDLIRSIRNNAAVTVNIENYVTIQVNAPVTVNLHRSSRVRKSRASRGTRKKKRKDREQKERERLERAGIRRGDGSTRIEKIRALSRMHSVIDTMRR